MYPECGWYLPRIKRMRRSWVAVPIDIVGGELMLQASTQDSAYDTTGARHKTIMEGEEGRNIKKDFVGQKVRNTSALDCNAIGRSRDTGQGKM